ncbi:Glycosyl hydrolases family 43 [Catalinimonas alkaloidigena]|uniref:Glycosyl hydrolases family 43 n=1 Tax=Catalinimonas alkaloidigena TaxID=1075417 RepID=A0A1G9HP70_9BACT|nr:glycoside hydrolase family 43 protein [Catalinimonas alkaloidigena]SDL14323.1 Glycosyl hydrolases family 43 [Catalinimonas alkaloidigena]
MLKITSRTAGNFLWLLCLLSSLVLAGGGSGHAQALRLPEMPLHDPYIVAHAPTKTYYLYTSNVTQLTGDKKKGIMVYTSKDLLHWQKPTVVFTVPQDSWANPEEGPWAPEVHAYRGKFYLFTTLHNKNKVIAAPPDVWRINQMRSTVVAVSNSPEGPFTLLKKDSPLLPAHFMTLDGTLYVDPEGQPWMVYAHEWLQKIDGTFEAVPLTDDLAKAAGDPQHLFKASDAPWLNAAIQPSDFQLHYVTDGCQLFRTKDQHLLMLWSSYEKGVYVQTVARSTTGTLQGPWEQLDPLVKHDSGHGMLFRTFEGQLMLVLHRPFRNARGKLYEVVDRGDHLEVVRERVDLDGEPEELYEKRGEK